MSDHPVKFGVSLHRIELHAGPLPDEDHFQWSLWTQAGAGDSVLVWGYVRRGAQTGFGQAQSFGVVLDRTWTEISASEESRAEFSEWVAAYASELLWDAARRALQAQAALMDFQFDLDVLAPPVELEFRAELESPSVAADARR
ncbi:hypothetical protein ACFPER_12040 [Agromyces aurantiacus]|uniref:Uncharacterized protein n=1 Tax=Agromyces aurantiacus TaxID=165814 RepID=A0ABV9RBH5_9MICO|nr:hypothetical protein [Agromyces aurantiacus]MBM7504211.1 hypothetical protein [Agromyces aurantiacus]